MAAVRCGDCGKVTLLQPDEGLSHHCPITGQIKQVHSDGTRVDLDREADPRLLPWAYRSTRPDAVRGPIG